MRCAPPTPSAELVHTVAEAIIERCLALCPSLAECALWTVLWVSLLQREQHWQVVWAGSNGGGLTRMISGK